MERILHIVGGMGLGGTESFLMNIYRNIDREKVQFDFLTYYDENEEGYFDKEIIELGGKIYNIKSVKKSGVFKFIKELRYIIKLGGYKVVHSHTMYNTGFSMLAAKLEKVNIRIAHAHSTNSMKKKFKENIYKKIMYLLINIFGNKFCACSQAASEHMFSSSNRNKRYFFIPNAVDFKKFTALNLTNINLLKKELKIPEESNIIGHIGRFSKVKNHNFIIEIFNDIVKSTDNTYLILVGDGPLLKDIEIKINSYDIKEKVKLLGLRSDIPNLMDIMDVFILPSYYEGLGIVLLEAQASGLPCIVSENVQPEVDMNLGLIYKAKLSNLEEWINLIKDKMNKKITNKEIIIDKINKSPYRLDSVIEKFYYLYEL